VPLLPVIAVAAVYAVERMMTSAMTRVRAQRPATRSDGEAVLAVAATAEGRRQ
jgi:hypothetical protein